MKIGIVTIYESITNMGSYLQAYALKTVLEQLGHEVVFVQNVPVWKTIAQRIFRLNPKREFFLRMAKAWYFYEDVKRLNRIPKQGVNAAGLDCLIYGSDEIWNLENPYFRDGLFWGCGVQNMKKVAYAISVGAMTEETSRQFEELPSGITAFDSILVRDERTYCFVEKKLGIAPDYVCDPTLLLPVSCLKRARKHSKQKYLLVYTYGIDAEMERLVVSFARKRGLQIVSPCFWHLWADKVVECSALELSTLMEDAEYVFTTTFHGAIFALLNHKRCCILPVREKVSDVVRRLGEGCRLIDEACDEERFGKIMDIPFDEENFEQRIAKWREESLERLRGALECSQE